MKYVEAVGDGLSGVYTIRSCDPSDLCSELSRGDSPEFRAVYGKYPSHRVLMSDGENAAIVDLSPLSVGHCLILPKFHFFNTHEAVSAASSQFKDFAERFLESWARLFGEYVVFEHGSTAGLQASACISHAHLHVMPLSLSRMAVVIERDNIELVPTRHWAAIEPPLSYSHYFLVADATSALVAFDPPRRPKQYLRSVAGSLLGFPESECDWAVAVRKNLLEETVRRWHGSGPI